MKSSSNGWKRKLPISLSASELVARGKRVIEQSKVVLNDTRFVISESKILIARLDDLRQRNSGKIGSSGERQAGAKQAAGSTCRANAQPVVAPVAVAERFSGGCVAASVFHGT